MSELRDRIASLTPEQRRQLEERVRATRNGTAQPRPSSPEPRLSFGQERLWQLAQRMGPSGVYNIHTSYRIRGALDVGLLEAAFADVVRSHGALRVTFTPETGRPRAEESEGFVLEVSSAPDLDAAMGAAKQWINQPLDVAVGPLFAAHLWELAPDDHLLSMRVHHLVCDGWSLSLVEDQLAAVYAGEAFEPSQVGFADFVEWERDNEASLRQRMETWSSVVADVETLRIPGERGAGGEVRFDLGPDLSEGIDAVAGRLRATPFRVLMAAFAVTLNRHTGQDDIVVCTPVAGRPDSRFERIVGYFNDIVPIRARLDGDPTVAEVVERLRDGWLASIDSPVPFQWIAAEAGSTALTRGLFALGVHREGLKLAGLEVEPVDVSSLISDFGVDWFMRRVGGEYRGVVRHQSSSDAPFAELTDTFTEVVELIIKDPGLRVSEFPDHSTPRTDSVPAATSQPKSPIEARLKGIWERVFQRPLSVDDDFFDIGGHSLLAAELIAEIEAEFGLENVPLSTLIEAPTVAGYARLLEAGEPTQRWESLVPIKPSGDRPPLYFIHAHGGNVIGYSPLGRHLSERQPLYGLQAPRGDLGVRKIEDIASSYIAEIKSLQPEGPYLLGGWCLGGDVAFEMGRQLRGAGEEVSLVLMVDNGRPEHKTATARGLRHIFNQVLSRFEMEWASLSEAPRKSRYLRERVGSLAERLVVEIERMATNAEGNLPFGLPHSRYFRQEQVASLHDKAYEGFTPGTYEGPVAVFRAELQPRGRTDDPTLGWSPLLEGRTFTYQLPGHRMGMLQEPRIARSAAIIEEAIAAATGEGE